PTLAGAQAATGALLDACTAWDAAAASGADPAAAKANAQAAWWAAMTAWQAAEVMSIGPAASSLTALGGESLRDEAYSWPSVNRCRVDQETVYENYAEEGFFDESLVNVYGLDALEVLLYSPGGENDCPGQVDINADGSWDALGVDGVERNRAAYALALAAHLHGTVSDLATRWDPAAGNFGAQLATAGETGSIYESPQLALNGVFDALFYLEITVKDRKLGYALGTGACASESCLDDIESPLAGGSSAWIAENLAAFGTLYAGAEGAGIDDLLVSIGEDDLAAAVDDALAGAKASALPAPLDASDPASVQAHYDAVNVLTDLLKGDIATALALQVPTEAAGDND
ncbi:MAG: hypothetical protein FJ090_13280, partial [Deltaproteobacteria bacterium]|nr:hypothetical protein [Deltaproteobacteria bacterium]